jgi:rubrerythrin
MAETKTTANQGALFEDSASNILTQIEKKADFLYSSIPKYMRDAEKDEKPELTRMWEQIKVDEQKHLGMLREELIRQVRENDLK